MESNVGGHGKKVGEVLGDCAILTSANWDFQMQLCKGSSRRFANHQRGAGRRISSHKQPLACLRQIVGGRMVVRYHEVRRLGTASFGKGYHKPSKLCMRT